MTFHPLSDLSGFHEAIFKGFDGERVIGPVRVYLKPHWKAREGSYFEEEGW